MSALQTMCTTWDIIGLFPQLWDRENLVFSEASEEEMRDTISLCDSQILSELRNLYSADLTTTPWVGTPFRPRGQSTSGKLRLTNGSVSISISDSALVYTGAYRFDFTSATEFTVTHDLRGTQGTGSTDSSFTSTDTFLTVPAALWEGTFAENDVVIVKVYEYSRMLVRLSSLLSTVTLLDSLFTDESPNASTASQKYQRAYDKLMKDIQKENAFLEAGLITQDISPIQVDYEVNEYGEDVTNYDGYDWDPAIGYQDLTE